MELEVLAIADELVGAVEQAFLLGVVGGAFVLGPLVVGAWQAVCDWREERAIFARLSAGRARYSPGASGEEHF